MARKSNVSLEQWHQMGGQTVDDDMTLDKTVHKSINSQSSVIKVENLFLPTKLNCLNIDQISSLEGLLHNKKINKLNNLLMQRYVADIGKAWPVLIVCGGIIPLILSVIWLAMIQRLVVAMTWITVVLFDILIISVTMFFYLKGLHPSKISFDDMG